MVALGQPYLVDKRLVVCQYADTWEALCNVNKPMLAGMFIFVKYSQPSGIYTVSAVTDIVRGTILKQIY